MKAFEGDEKMKIYDISQEIFNCQVYPGDPIPEKRHFVQWKKVTYTT